VYLTLPWPSSIQQIPLFQQKRFILMKSSHVLFIEQKQIWRRTILKSLGTTHENQWIPGYKNGCNTWRCHVEHNLFWWNSPFLFFFYEKNVVFRIFTPNIKGFLEKKNRGNISGRAGTLNKQFFLCGLNANF
jgi:hypothetical protein